MSNHIDDCLNAQYPDDPEIVEETKKEIKEGFNSILENGGSYDELEDLMLDNGIDLDGIEDLLLGEI